MIPPDAIAVKDGLILIAHYSLEDDNRSGGITLGELQQTSPGSAVFYSNFYPFPYGILDIAIGDDSNIYGIGSDNSLHQYKVVDGVYCRETGSLAGSVEAIGLSQDLSKATAIWGDSRGTVFYSNDLTTVTSTWKAHSGEVWACSFNQTEPHLLATGADDFFMRIWDLRTQDPVHQVKHDCGVTVTKFRDQGLLTGSYDGIIRCFDTRYMGKPVYQLKMPDKDAGIWRIVPEEGLIAGSYGGCFVVTDLLSSSCPEVTHTFKGPHNSMVYGIAQVNPKQSCRESDWRENLPLDILSAKKLDSSEHSSKCSSEKRFCLSVSFYDCCLSLWWF